MLQPPRRWATGDPLPLPRIGRIGQLSLGLNPDKDGRDSLAYHLMELERPAVDGPVLHFLASTMLHTGDFTRVSDGSCRLHPQLARAVVAGSRVPHEQIDEHAKWLAAMLNE